MGINKIITMQVTHDKLEHQSLTIIHIKPNIEY